MTSEWDETFHQQSREERELQYSPSRWTKRITPPAAVVEAHLRILKQASEGAKETIDCELDIPYGDKPLEKLDIYGAKSLPKDAPVVVYLHGGDWTMMGKEYSAFMAPSLVKSGIVLIAVGYHKAPEVDMPEIVAEIKKATAYILKWAHSRGSLAVYPGGHCAGGHLAAMMLGIDWMAECGIANEIIQGAILLAGVFDVRPLVDTYIGDPLTLALESAWTCSPCRYIDTIAALSGRRRVIIVTGGEDTPSFRQQSLQFSKALQKRNVPVILKDIPEYDHFLINENLRFEDDSLGQEIIAMIMDEK